MTKAKISQYDASADGNTDVNGVNIAEGCAPSGINNAIREVMAAVKRFETGSDGDSVTVGGNFVVVGSTTANTIAATVVNASGNATVGGTLVVTGATTFSGNVVISGSTTATTVSTTVVQSDTISEKTSAAGVTVDGVLLKDTTVTANTIKASGTSSSQGEVQLFEDTDNGTNYVAFKAPASIASDVTWTLPNVDGSANQALVTNGTGTLSWASAGGTTLDTQTFNSSGTWTKPAGCTFVQVIAFGAGGGGGVATAGGGGGGGGGGGAAVGTFLASDLGSTETVTVGTGGAGGASANTNGTAGGDTSFGTVLYARGGGRGATAGTGAGGGGGGGGAGDSTSTVGGNGSGGTNGTGGAASSIYAGDVGSRVGSDGCGGLLRRPALGGDGHETAANKKSGIIVGVSAIGSLIVGGGAGGARGDDTTLSNPGGNSSFGGGGGGGASDTGAGGTGGTGGNGGGNGGRGSGTGGAAANGTAPGGGGGGGEGTALAGAGAAGRVIVYSW